MEGNYRGHKQSYHQNKYGGGGGYKQGGRDYDSKDFGRVHPSRQQQQRRPDEKYSRGGYGGNNFGQQRPNYNNRGYDQREERQGGDRYGGDRGGYQKYGRPETGRYNRDERPRDYQRDGDDQKYSRGPQFSAKARPSHQASSNPEDPKGNPHLQLMTNQFRLKISKDFLQFYQYPIKVEAAGSGELGFKCTPNMVEKLVRKVTNKLQSLVGQFIHSGFNLWLTRQVPDSYVIETDMGGQPVNLIIDHEGEFEVNASSIDNANRADSQAMRHILNVLIKNAMSDTGLKQLGNRPRYFDASRPIEVPDLGINIWSGFKTSAYKYASGCTLIIDNCSRFMSTQTVLARMKEIKDQTLKRLGRKAYEDSVRREIVGSSVIANYGAKRTYIVQDILFEKGPLDCYLKDGEQKSKTVADYFFEQYSIKITDKFQPMLIMSRSTQDVSIPSELCIMDGVPEQIRKNGRDMRNLLNRVKQNPNEKMQSIRDMIAKLFASSKTCQKWGVTIDTAPVSMTSRQLPAPQALQGSKTVDINETMMKQLPVFSCDQLSEKQIVVVHDNLHPNCLQRGIDSLEKCQGSLRIKTRKFETLNIGGLRGKFDKIKEKIHHFVDDCIQARRANSPMDFFVVYVVGHERDYTNVKQLLTDLNLLSQVVQQRTFDRLNLSVASNIMKQINSKVGGESLRVKMPEVVQKSRVMVIGIDVCHAGKNSLVGFVATTDSSFNHLYSDLIIQPKFTEIIQQDLNRCLKAAIDQFKIKNEGEIPEKIVIYRDGVGEQMRDQIIDKEVKQIKTVLKDLINKAAEVPQVTLIVVNKRINQRMFMQNKDSVFNPPPGSIIDKDLVENDQGNYCFDFFMVPQKTTQGCVTPTHFFVHMNEWKELSKEAIEAMTFGFCFTYTNWSGSIKVPAPCQYGHKMAEYHYGFDTRGSIKKRQKVNFKDLGYNDSFRTTNYFL